MVDSNITFSTNPISAIPESTKVVNFEDPITEQEEELNIDLI